jgi:hypothetical protein
VNKISDDLESQGLRLEKKGVIYDKGTIKVVVFACLVIMAAVVFTGGVSYYITRTAIVDKLKARDLIYIVESITSKVDGRIERAKETSLMLASDPTVVQWIAGGEKDEQLGQCAKNKINDIAKNYDYANSFIVSAVTNDYWAEDFKLIQVMSPDDPNAKWFYNALNSGKVVDLNIDYNSGRQDTFVFLNALVGDAGHPLAVAGVGLSLNEIAQEFHRYKVGERSNLWLVDNSGKIHLSDDLGYNGRNLDDYIPAEVFSQVISDKENASSSPKVIEYINTNGEMMDLVYQSMKSTDWKVVFQIPRSESIAFLGSIKFNTMVASIVTLLLLIFIFYVVSRKIPIL